jgi:hypothetical protein
MKNKIAIIAIVGIGFLLLMPTVLAQSYDPYSIIYSIKDSADLASLAAIFVAVLAIIIIILQGIMVYYLAQLTKFFKMGAYRR